jgi:peptide/nickel transport system substrate-binding protein/oligopeptide transport system substrate-binding protein
LKKIIITLLTMLLLGCGSGPGGEDSLHLVLEVSPNKLDPAFVVDVAEGEIASMIFQGLVRFSLDGEVTADAASSWRVSEDGRRYVFTLDRRMVFSNGRRIAARDVEFSFERILSPKSNSPRKWVLSRIQGADAFASGESSFISGLHIPNDSTIVLELSEPFRPFLMLLAMPAAMIVPAEEVQHNSGGNEQEDAVNLAPTYFAEHPVGSGPWKLDSWERSDFLTLVPNPHHPNRERLMHAVRFRIIPEAFTRIAEFESGALDVLKIPNAELLRFLGDAKYRERIQSVPELRVLYIGLNNTRGPLRDVRVRKALNLAVDVERIIKVLAAGEAVRAAGAVPPTLNGYAGRSPYSYDPRAARELMSAAGYADGFAIEIWQRDSPEGNRIVEAVQGYLGQVGVEVRIVKREWSAFKEAVSRGKVDAFFLDWYADYPDAENFLFPLFHSENRGGGGNRSFFVDARVDSLIELSQRAVTDSICYDLYARVDSLVYSQAPWIYLYFPKLFEVMSERVTGYRIPFLYLARDYSSVRKSAAEN